jgi:RNA polymerase sigma factor (sigma-70 family)
VDCRPSVAAFATTRWTVVLAAGGDSSPTGREALNHLCQAYWPPVYAYARRAGHGPEDARDLTQGFFRHLLETGALARANPQRGRFRSFLLGAFKHFRAHERDRARTLKRGGAAKWVSIDPATDNPDNARTPLDPRTPDRAFEERWAAALLERVLTRLRDEFTQSGRLELFDAFKGCLLGQSVEGGYTTVATKLGMTEGAAKMTVTRLRDRYRRLLRAEVAQTLANPGDVDDELRHLLAILRAGIDPQHTKRSFPPAPFVTFVTSWWSHARAVTTCYPTICNTARLPIDPLLHTPPVAFP